MNAELIKPSVAPADPSWWFADALKQEAGEPASPPLMGEIKDVQDEIVDMKSNRLERVLAALDRIDDRTYGICIRCGKPIDPRRLDADPAALTCMDCLSAEEKNFETATM